MASQGLARVLVVDDDSVTREIYRMCFQRLNFDITFAGDGQQAEDILSQTVFPLIILDLMMPGISGLEVLEWLQHRPNRAESVVVVSTAATHLTGGEVRKLSDYVFHKPIDVFEFTAFIERL